ncbi:MAG TPA: cation diffusion facilitator family transporter [Acidimicrobiales bacterium]|nr:cation diffusion facilitator family transporter [Acidimicrobiales bacterium]
MTERNLTRYAWLSIAAAVTTIAMKSSAFLLTGSVGLLSDALESVVNLVAAMVALVALRLAARPPDEEHHFGYGKAEYFSAGVEGVMILAAAGAVIASAIPRFLHPRALEQVGIGLVVSGAAALVNLGVALVLRRAGREHRSITLTADARHLLTDVWTTGGVVIGVGLVGVTGWQRLDPIVAILVGVNIVVAGFALLRHSGSGLMDSSLPADDVVAIENVLDRYRADGVEFHALRTRAAGAHRFVSMHVLVPGDWTVTRGHEFVARVEADIAAELPLTSVATHLEPVGDPISYEDIELFPPGRTDVR